MNLLLAVLLPLVPLALAVAADLLLGELPPNAHPVVWMGRYIKLWEQWAPSAGALQQFLVGVALTITGMIVFGVVPGLVISWLPALLAIIPAAVLLKTAFAGKMLWEAALQVEQDLRDNNILAARMDLRSLVSRDTTTLPRPLLAAAAVESVAENITDSIVSPLLAFSLFGVSGSLAYRYANTCDSMIGYRTIQYEFLGKFAAILDDLLNFIPARLTGGMIVLAAAMTGGNYRRAWKIMLRDHGNTTSPNAGWTMAAMSGALGVRLEKRDHYTLGGEFAEPDTFDIIRAVKLMRYTYGLAVALAALLILGRTILLGGLFSTPRPRMIA